MSDQERSGSPLLPSRIALTAVDAAVVVAILAAVRPAVAVAVTASRIGTRTRVGIGAEAAAVRSPDPSRLSRPPATPARPSETVASLSRRDGEGPPRGASRASESPSSSLSRSRSLVRRERSRPAERPSPSRSIVRVPAGGVTGGLVGVPVPGSGVGTRGSAGSACQSGDSSFVPAGHQRVWPSRRTHPVDLVVAVAAARERDPRPSGENAGPSSTLGGRCQLPLRAAVRAHDPDVLRRVDVEARAALEGQPRGVRRPCGAES